MQMHYLITLVVFLFNVSSPVFAGEPDQASPPPPPWFLQRQQVQPTSRLDHNGTNHREEANKAPEARAYQIGESTPLVLLSGVVRGNEVVLNVAFTDNPYQGDNQGSFESAMGYFIYNNRIAAVRTSRDWLERNLKGVFESRRFLRNNLVQNNTVALLAGRLTVQYSPGENTIENLNLTDGVITHGNYEDRGIPHSLLSKIGSFQIDTMGLLKTKDTRFEATQGLEPIHGITFSESNFVAIRQISTSSEDWAILDLQILKTGLNYNTVPSSIPGQIENSIVQSNGNFQLKVLKTVLQKLLSDTTNESLASDYEEGIVTILEGRVLVTTYDTQASNRSGQENENRYFEFYLQQAEFSQAQYQFEEDDFQEFQGIQGYSESNSDFASEDTEDSLNDAEFDPFEGLNSAE